MVWRFLARLVWLCCSLQRWKRTRRKRKRRRVNGDRSHPCTIVAAPSCQSASTSAVRPAALARAWTVCRCPRHRLASISSSFCEEGNQDEFCALVWRDEIQQLIMTEAKMKWRRGGFRASERYNPCSSRLSVSERVHTRCWTCDLCSSALESHSPSPVSFSTPPPPGGPWMSRSVSWGAQT